MVAVVGLSTIVVCGGVVGGQENNTCEQFANNKWTDMSITMPNSIAFFAMTALNDDLFIFGGYDKKRNDLNTVYMYENKLTPEWSVRASMPVTANGHTVVALLNDTILLCGGTQNGIVANTCFLYTPLSNNWNDAWPMNDNRTGHALSLYKGVVYAYGGKSDKDAKGTLLSSIEILTYTSGWRVLPYTINQSNAFFASVVLPEPTASIWPFITPAICVIVLSAIVVVYVVLVQCRRQLAIQRVFIKDMQFLVVC